jgi:hypothetical protein
MKWVGGKVDAPIHDANELLLHVLGTLHTSRLNEVFVTSKVREFSPSTHYTQ